MEFNPKTRNGWLGRLCFRTPISHAVFRDYPPYVHTLVAKYLNDSDFFEKVKEILDYKYSIPVPKYFTDYKNLLQEERKFLNLKTPAKSMWIPILFLFGIVIGILVNKTLYIISKYLYDVLELEGYDEQSARSYYRSWIKKLEELI